MRAINHLARGISQNDQYYCIRYYACFVKQDAGFLIEMLPSLMRTPKSSKRSHSQHQNVTTPITEPVNGYSVGFSATPAIA